MIAWFARHQTAANLLMAAIILLGLVAVPGLQCEALPEIKNDKVEVRAIYKGAAILWLSVIFTATTAH